MKDHQLAAVIVLPIALIGMLINWMVSIMIIKFKSMKNTFGRLTLSQSIGDALHSTTFFIYVVPMCYLNDEWMRTNSKYCGHVLLVIYDISTYSHIFISLNRFSSIVFPVKYDTIFSMTNTNIMIALSWALAIFPSFYLYSYHDCQFYFINDFWVFTFSTSPSCVAITWYADFLKYNTIVIFIVVIDIITVIKLRIFKKKVSSTTSATRRTYEMDFLKQACLQALVFLFELITYFVITPKIALTERWTRFFLSTVAWVSVHMLDGVITFSFNPEFRKFVMRAFPIKNQNLSTQQASSRQVII